MDQLEKYILENKAAFDDQVPNDQLWLNIQSKMGKPSKMFVFWKIAALFLLMTTSVLIIERQLSSGESQEISLGEEFLQAEGYYLQVINTQQAELKHLEGGNTHEELLIELQELDAAYQNLKSTYINQNSDEMLKGAMIENLIMRMEILNRQITILKKFNTKENENITI